ncbi:DUF72 domain-containing protein [Streptomyces sp. CA-210063]|uniref:DUF72 domain-containing protein n=1 Tax=Streptomyces sp. CA-210063 TaxID=2801029 RepID=UPI00214C25D9|nr:DUF72 domain-containing protein [Streptomyces sp. CA-210063]UUU32748.1 DUF72 domain-containing protein [Streptomyces sp. CA-210063]
MGHVLVGTCSWTDRALLASGWYPRGRRDAEPRLRYYAEQFPVVEVDSSYYALPSRRNSLLWAERTPPGFRFDIKAFSLLTGHPTRPTALPEDLREGLREGLRENRRDGTPELPELRELLDRVWERFTDAVEPLRTADRLGAVLFQFPPWFAPGRPARRAERTLEECAERTAGWPVSVEFRHPGWWRGEQADRTTALLARLGLIAVGVDMARDLDASLPPLAPVTSPELAVVRFHGRSPAWGTGSKEDRFRYAYSEPELAEWAPRLRAAAEQVDELHVLFNNCCADAAVRAAETMRRVLAAT